MKPTLQTTVYKIVFIEGSVFFSGMLRFLLLKRCSVTSLKKKKTINEILFGKIVILEEKKLQSKKTGWRGSFVRMIKRRASCLPASGFLLMSTPDDR